VSSAWQRPPPIRMGDAHATHDNTHAHDEFIHNSYMTHAHTHTTWKAHHRTRQGTTHEDGKRIPPGLQEREERGSEALRWRGRWAVRTGERT
jgi:hypothetical protein